jgi:ATP-dependent phosphofructokinase / diphosphate-dependent phosphofructokinase
MERQAGLLGANEVRMTSNLGGKRLGILVGGGPAPGINSAIGAATIEAVRRGYEVVGILDGYEHLIDGRTNMVRRLTIPDVSRIHTQGGSVLRTSRANPTKTAETLQRTADSLRELGIAHLVTIGGDDTAYGSFEVARASGGGLRVAHVPKTIDNDLPLPGGLSTFGYQTARHVGAEIVSTLMEDSRTTQRWFVVVVMGRKAGHLALGIGKAAGATLTIIPEEFENEVISLDQVCDVIEGAIYKRRVSGRRDGVVVVGEGVGEKLDPSELAQLAGIQISYDPYGHIALADIPLASLIKQRIQKRLADRGEKISLVDVTVGYELRCAHPTPFDIDYTRTLGYGAVRFLTSDSSDANLRDGGVVCLIEGHLQIVPFDDMRDPVTGRTRIRLVDVRSEHYRVAHDYMIRLEPSDLEDPTMLQKLAEAAHVTPEEFRRQFAFVTRMEALIHAAA